MIVHQFDPYYTVNKKTQEATKVLLENAALNGEDKSITAKVVDAKNTLIKVFDNGLANDFFRATDSGPLTVFNKYLDCIFRLKPNSDPSELTDEVEFLNKNTFLFFLLQNIAEAAADLGVNRTNAQDALLRVAYFLSGKKDTRSFEYQGKNTHLVWTRDDEAGKKEMRMSLVQPPAIPEKPNKKSGLLNWWFKKP